MKISQSKVITITVVLAVFALVSVVRLRDRRGTVSKLTDLPRFGLALPSVETGRLAYEYNPRIERVLARGSATTNAFFAVCAQLKLEMIQYERGFPRSDMITDASKFVPVGERVWCGFGKLYLKGRTALHIYFEPPQASGTNSEGTLYLHIL